MRISEFFFKIALSQIRIAFSRGRTYENVTVHFHGTDCRGQVWWRTGLLTPWCRILLEKLTGLQLVKKFPAFHGTRRFITTLISVRHLSLSWASPIQSIYPHPTSCRSILILSTHLRLGIKNVVMKKLLNNWI